jgi:hypothetical protein
MELQIKNYIKKNIYFEYFNLVTFDKIFKINIPNTFDIFKCEDYDIYTGNVKIYDVSSHLTLVFGVNFKMLEKLEEDLNNKIKIIYNQIVNKIDITTLVEELNKVIKTYEEIIKNIKL